MRLEAKILELKEERKQLRVSGLDLFSNKASQVVCFIKSSSKWVRNFGITTPGILLGNNQVIYEELPSTSKDPVDVGMYF